MAFKIEHYIMGETIGVGSFAKVKKATHEFTGSEVAIKIINKQHIKSQNLTSKVTQHFSFNYPKQIRQEIRLLRAFHHPNIIRLYEVFDTPQELYIVMEYSQGGELFDLIQQKGKLSEEEACFYFRQIISGVEYCHHYLVAHRDLKPENILIDGKKTIKICDFGLANLMKDGKFLKTSCGSPNYASPEIISGKKYCGSAIDVWSCGVILYALLTGSLPFDAEFIPPLFKMIKEGKFKMPTDISKAAQDILSQLLQPDPLKRIRFHEIKNHAFMQYEIPFYIGLKIPTLAYQEQNKINEDIFKQLLQMDFYFYSLEPKRIKAAILRRKNYGFVIGYYLMLDDYYKKILFHQDNSLNFISTFNSFLVNKDIMKSDVFQQVLGNVLKDHNKAILELQDENFKIRKTQSRDDKIEEKRWSYLIAIQHPLDDLLHNINITLNQFGTVRIFLFVKLSFQQKLKIDDQYKIKCCIKTQPLLQIKQNKDQNDEFEIGTPTTSHTSINEEQKEQTSNEIIFYIQIFKDPGKKNKYALGFQRAKGDLISFMDYSHRFASTLLKNMNKINQTNIMEME